MQQSRTTTSTVSNILTINPVGFSTAPTFNLSLGEIQTITMLGDISKSAITNLVKGMNIKFVIRQDIVGFRKIVWPTNVKGAMDISSSGPNGTCVQSFISHDGINLYAEGIGVLM